MNYKEKYEKALEKARDMLSYKEVRREDMEYIFPELRESEDEKVREWIYNYFRSCFPTWIHPDITCGEILDWLEKQGKKSIWSEDDEERFQSCLNILQVQAKGFMGITETINTKWLKSLKNRIKGNNHANLQP